MRLTDDLVEGARTHPYRQRGMGPGMEVGVRRARRRHRIAGPGGRLPDVEETVVHGTQRDRMSVRGVCGTAPSSASRVSSASAKPATSP